MSTDPLDLRAQLQAHLGAAFTLERELGGGGMSRVFLAYEIRLGRKVVIKVLSPDLVMEINTQRFEREILLAASLQQANIVPVLAAGEVNGLPYFTMPYVDGESLRKRLGAGPLPIPDVVAILRDVTKALAYAHAHAVVHRDIKPDNVLLSGGTAVVTDFGIAKALSASRSGDAGVTLTQLGTSIGTPAYMAPEQIAGDPHLDHRVDLYALGCVAHELLTGQPPFADRTPQKVFAAHLSQAPIPVMKLRGETPLALAAVVARLLQKEPADRIQSAAEVLHELDGIGTTSSERLALSGPGMLPRVLGLYLLATGAAAILAKAAVVGIGLPDWVFPGTMLVMLMGLPAILATAYVKRVARRNVHATPTLTPGGTSVARGPTGTIATMALKAHPHVSWRRTARGGMYAMGGFIAVVALFMILRGLGIGPWGSLLARGAMARDSRIVLASLTSAPDDSALAPIVAEAARAALSQSTSIKVMDQVEVLPILLQMRRATNAPLDVPTAREVATRAGASAVLGGRLARVGTGYAVSLELTSAADGSVLASYQGTADGPRDLLTVVDKLAKNLRGRIGESLRSVQRTVPLAQATTSSLEALRKYSEGVEANDLTQDYDRAVQLLREAVTLDSTFALAWRKLGVALGNASAATPAIDSAIERANRYADRLPDREKYLVRGFYYESHRTARDRGKALAAYQAAYAADSTTVTAMSQMMAMYGGRGQIDSLERYAVRIRAVRPNVRTTANWVVLLANSGRVDSGVKVLDSLVRASPEAAASVPVLRARSFIYLARAQWDSAAVIAAILARSPSVPNHLNGLSDQMDLATMSGQLARAASLDSTINAQTAAHVGTPAIDGLQGVESDIWFRGRAADGIRRLDAIVTGRQWSGASPIYRPYLRVARAYATGARPERARQILTRFEQEDPDWFKAPAAQNRIAAIRGEIALAEGKSAEAIQQFRIASVAEDGWPAPCTGCVAFALARAFDRAGQVDSALAEYERYLTFPTLSRIDAPALADVQKRLGELYDAKNDRPKAIEHYQAFVDQWKHADADLQPVVTQVRRRLGELVAQEAH